MYLPKSLEEKYELSYPWLALLSLSLPSYKKSLVKLLKILATFFDNL